MTDYELFRIVISNLLVAIIFGSLLSLFVYLRGIRQLSDTLLKKRRLIIGVIGVLLCVVFFIVLFGYGNVVFVPIR
jgi:hypothetical protein